MMRLQAAYLLGFADQTSFFRACKRWYDLAPFRSTGIGIALVSPVGHA
jgi:hypothetical protein